MRSCRRAFRPDALVGIEAICTKSIGPEGPPTRAGPPRRRYLYPNVSARSRATLGDKTPPSPTRCRYRTAAK
ncbi:DUF6053 domain-containing protein [Lysobacter enzymogenes]|uniref:DUF6053 domain-containing protein n=1 Tax=Lysobacter enzymogenes TaxID=69 RepID=UPI003D189599